MNLISTFSGSNSIKLPAKSRNLSHKCCQKSADFPQNCCRCLWDRNILSAWTSIANFMMIRWSLTLANNWEHVNSQLNNSMIIYLSFVTSKFACIQLNSLKNRNERFRPEIVDLFVSFFRCFSTVLCSCVCWMKCKQNKRRIAFVLRNTCWEIEKVVEGRTAFWSTTYHVTEFLKAAKIIKIIDKTTR